MKYNTVAYYYRTNLLILASAWILMTLLIVPTVLINTDFSQGLPIILLLSLPLAVMCLYYAISFFQYRNIVLTNIQFVTLRKVVSNSFLRQMAFEVELELNGKKEFVETKAIFNASTLIPHLSIDQYSGALVEVGYCETRQEAIVIRIVEEIPATTSVEKNEENLK